MQYTHVQKFSISRTLSILEREVHLRYQFIRASTFEERDNRAALATVSSFKAEVAEDST